MTLLRLYIPSALGAAALITAMVHASPAHADDYAGKTYSDASSALSDAGLKGVIVNRFGDTLAQDQCVVTRSQNASWLKGDHFSSVADTVLLYLNCNATVASANQPGNSVASPEGRAALQAAQDQASQNASSAG